MRKTRDKILLLGNYRPTITLARTFGRQGYAVIVTSGGGEGLSEYSRYVSGVWDEPDPADGESEFIAALSAYLAEHPDITVIVPVTERYAIAVARHQSVLPGDRLVASPDADLVLSTLDKPKLFERVRVLGVPIAPFRRVESHGALLDAADDIGTPMVIRPLKSEVRLLGKKALTVGSKAELMSMLPAWPQEHAGLLAQRKVPGLRHNFYFAAEAGRIVRSVETKILDTDHADGSGLATDGMTIETTPEIAQYTATILEDLSYQGIGCAQYLVDGATGAINFLEINPRIAGNHAVPEAAGLELGPVAVRLARGDAPPVPVRAGHVGLRYSWTYGAVRALSAQLSNGEATFATIPKKLLQIVRSCVLSDVHMTWSISDPLPTIALFAKQFAPALIRPRTPEPERSRPLVETKGTPHA